MANSILLNQALISGNYSGLPLDVDSNLLSTTIVNGLTVVKTADMAVWASGYLTYTITIDNQSSEDYVTPTLTDTLDILQITLVANSVTVGGSVAVYTFDSLTGLLTVVLPTVADTDLLEITYQVQMV